MSEDYNGMKPEDRKQLLQQNCQKALLSEEQLKAHEFPLRVNIISPWLRMKTIILGYGWRGVAKTWTGLTISLAATRRNQSIFNEWVTENPVNVLHVDGEMDSSELQERATKLTKLMEEPEKEWHLLAADHLSSVRPPAGPPNFVDQEWRESVAEIIRDRDIELLVLDNIGSLFVGLDENVKSDWDEANQWLIGLKHSGVSILMLHHTGKNGTQRGTSAREDNIDLSFKLSVPRGHSVHDGACICFKWEKARGFHGEAARPFIADLVELDGGLTWHLSTPKADKMKDFLELYYACDTQNQVAEKMGLKKWDVTRLKQDAQREELLNKDGSFTTRGLELINRSKEST